ncbi:hypothetical protein HMPREF3033_00593 [Veillonellaceae bacterium DNF00751]|nr:hypothetical protein HMPREF3033_00593 [Veillonellaceae bacterium DNF00751]
MGILLSLYHFIHHFVNKILNFHVLSHFSTFLLIFINTVG